MNGKQRQFKEWGKTDYMFTSNLLRGTKNIRIVQKALGHADISYTQIYTHIVDEELEDAMEGLRKQKI